MIEKETTITEEERPETRDKEALQKIKQIVEKPQWEETTRAHIQVA